MKINEDRSLKIAQYLLQIKAIKLNLQKPFTWASGWKSPIYCDNRKTLSYPVIRTYIRQQFCQVINEEFSKPEVIAAVATGAIAMGALVAQDLGLPFVYVRSSAKDHGLENAIEGVIESGQSVVVIEDLISTGASSLKAVEILRKAGCDVKGMASIFTYGFPQAADSFKKAKVKLCPLSDYNYLLKHALESNFIREAELAPLAEWREAPELWGTKK
jgi:orotate phosphoribosyltransferase